MFLPSHWLNFPIQKEIKRIHHDLKNTIELKIQIAVSIILAIATIVFDDDISNTDICGRILIFVLVCITIAMVFTFPNLYRKLRNYHRGTVIFDRKTATSIFDEEIIYSILTAAEFQNYKERVDPEIDTFYKIEIEYYLLAAIRNLSRFSSFSKSVFGEKENQISNRRGINAIDMIESINNQSHVGLEQTEDYKLIISLRDSLKEDRQLIEETSSSI